jgi:hypothetical protein
MRLQWNGLIALCSVFLYLCAFSSDATSGSRQDVQKVIEFLKHKARATEGVDYSAPWRDSEGGQFIYNQKKYTVYYSGTYWENKKTIPAKERGLNILVRAVGSEELVASDAFDIDLDGSVVQGFLGLPFRQTWSDSARKRFVSGKVLCYSKVKELCRPGGFEFRPYWQERGDVAIRDILDFYQK